MAIVTLPLELGGRITFFSFNCRAVSMMDQAPTSTLVVVLMVSLFKPFLASATRFENTSFDFPSFSSESLKLLDIQGNASVLSPNLYLSPSQPNQNPSGNCGQAMYSKEMRLWDKATGNAADFVAQFVFSIDSQSRNVSGDGLAFFVAPPGSGMSCDWGGEYLGLPRGSFVAIEIDTFKNPWDGDVPHVGIDLNNIRSVANVAVPWLNKTMKVSGLVNASITYESQAKNLSVVLMDADGNSSNSISLHYAPLNLSEYLPEWVDVGFSAATGAAFEYHIIHSWEFSSSLRLRPEKTTLSWRQWLLIAIGCVGILVVIILAWVYCRAKVTRPYPSNVRREDDNASKKTEENMIDTERGIEEDDHNANLTEKLEKLRLKKFSYEELMTATNSFAEARILGKGGFGNVYEGHIGDACTPVAVKIIHSDSNQGIDEYLSEVMSGSQLKHRNLVQLLGYCHEANKFALVYEFMREGSLEDHLFKGRSLLTWERRYNIAQGLASGLHHLHEKWNQCVIHRDIKSSNALLDEKFEAKLGDFGLARLVDHAKGQKTTQLKGTQGYLAPECYQTGKVSKESDVFSFGVVLLEIVCGRRVIQDQVHLVEWVRKQYGQGNLPMDLKLGINFDKEQAKVLMIVGLWCAHLDVSLRPSIAEAMSILNSRADLSNLPADLRQLMEGPV
ncbi:L-type lectin-domain containing receptor kinase IX.2-like [Rhodamnia argentea]|uniref:L-type lectin-domain containing receptor kinase IX.2-like n=1 Tax=Rhodamnia argentea TaxID=178133 RepID=A0ABM3H4X1_9MYRT|nr:L-type lectin-domain containing receptor kinase IX.2-like [Rhodamnia argentea]